MILRSKSIAPRVFDRQPEEEPLGCVLESMLQNEFECEKGTRLWEFILNSGKYEELALNTFIRGQELGLIKIDGEVARLNPDEYQKIMNIAGVWYAPFKVPEGVTALCLSDEGAKMFEDVDAGKMSMEELAKKMFDKERRK